MGGRTMVKEVMSGGASPGPIYVLRSSVGSQPTSNRKNSPRFGFGSTQPRNDDAANRKKAAETPDPGAYWDGVSEATGVLSMGSRVNLGSPRNKNLDRSIGGGTPGPGPAAPNSPRRWPDSPRSAYSEKRSSPMYSMRSPAGIPDNTAEASPGPAMYDPRSKSRFGGGYIGDARSFSLYERQMPACQYISKQHANKTLQCTQSPGPVYTPREMFGVVDYTNSNTSRHSPKWEFGSGKRL